MRLTPLVAAVAATAAAALPAQATPPTLAISTGVCVVDLVSVDPGGTASCSTSPQNLKATSDFLVRRTMDVYVRNGVADATLTCGFGINARTVTKRITAPALDSLSMYELPNSNICTARLTAVTDLTVAAATSTFSYRPPRVQTG